MEKFPGSVEVTPQSTWERHKAWVWPVIEKSAKVLGSVALALVAREYIASGLDTSVLMQNAAQIAVSLLTLGGAHE